jgi:hypothetical protein
MMVLMSLLAVLFFKQEWVWFLASKAIW